MTSIKCAHCKETHSSVEQVRACSQGRVKVPGLNRLVPKSSGVVPGTAWLENHHHASGANLRGPGKKPVGLFPAGRYAIHHPEKGLRFYRIDKPTEGRWAGYTFVKVEANDDVYPVKSWNEQHIIFAEIEKDPKAAAERYGKAQGVCGMCGRKLTDPDSINRGIGPVCAGKF